MICENCGAHFDDELPKCPYCDAFHYAGARKEYMGKLEDMKEDLDDLHETVPEMYQAELKNQTKQVKKIALIIAAIFTVLILLFMTTAFLFENSGTRNQKEVLLFIKEAYPVMDEFYEAEDFDGMLNFYYNSLQENENADFYSWDHYPFLMCYENLDIFQESADQLNTPDFTDFDMHEIFYCYISTHYCQKEKPLEEMDRQYIASIEQEMKTVIDSLDLTSGESEALNDLLSSGDYPSWKEIEAFSKKVYKRMF